MGFPQDYIFARYAKVDKWVDYTSHKKGDLIVSEDRFAFTVESESIAAPLLYEAQKWLREEKNIYVTVGCPQIMNEGLGWSYEVCDKPWNGYSDDDCVKASGGAYDSYEEALSEGLRTAIEILKEN